MQSVVERLPLLRGDRLTGRARREALRMLREMQRPNPETWLHRYYFYAVNEKRLSPYHRHPEVVEYRFERG